MGKFNKMIEHDGGIYDVEIDIEGDQAVIYFGASFTLRVDEANLNKLRQVIHLAARDLTIERRDTVGVYSEVDEISLEDLEAAEEMYQAVNDAMDKMTDQMMKGPTTTFVEKNIEDWNPNDPSNW
jgi:ribosome-associated translation inhibitor RaiA|tara:strand:- start:1130 stop:1504 length:375 start_codon:yes stop_codon:yes gene_type:complete